MRSNLVPKTTCLRIVLLAVPLGWIALLTQTCALHHRQQGQRQLAWCFPELAPHVTVPHYSDEGGLDVLSFWQVKAAPDVVVRELLHDPTPVREPQMGVYAPPWWPSGKPLKGRLVYYQQRHNYWRHAWHNPADDTYYLLWYDT